jgi:hypothetical protein
MGIAVAVVLAALLGFAILVGFLLWIYTYPPDWAVEFSRLMHILRTAMQVCVHTSTPSTLASTPLHPIVWSAGRDRRVSVAQQRTTQMVGPVKFKVAIGFYQIISGLEGTFDIGPLPEDLKTVIKFFEWMELNWTVLAFPVGCVDSYLERLAVAGFGPIVLIVLVVLIVAIGTLVEAVLHPPESKEAPIKTIALRSVPLSVLIIFMMLPSVSRSVFASWLCVRYGSGPEGSDEYVYFMLRDAGTMCYSDRYYGINAMAVVLLIIWPIGMWLFLYGITFVNRETLLAGKTNRLSEYTRFLTSGYMPQFYYWESVDLFRRLVCTGWVVLVPYNQSILRLIVAIILSVLILLATAYAMPCRRHEDNAITLVAQTALILVYVSCLLVRITDSDSLTDREKWNLLGFHESMYFYFIIIACTLIFLLMILSMLVYGIVDEIQRVAIVKRMEGWGISDISAPGLATGCVLVGGCSGCLFASVFGLLSGFTAGLLGGLIGGIFGAKYGHVVGDALSPVNPLKVKGKFITSIEIRRISKRSNPTSRPVPGMDAMSSA